MFFIDCRPYDLDVLERLNAYLVTCLMEHENVREVPEQCAVIAEAIIADTVSAGISAEGIAAHCEDWLEVTLADLTRGDTSILSIPKIDLVGSIVDLTKSRPATAADFTMLAIFALDLIGRGLVTIEIHPWASVKSTDIFNANAGFDFSFDLQTDPPKDEIKRKVS
ncbi:MULTISPECIES: hypothetical protein [unclassified Chelatococcus]|uniref:hypothetical protein n=1 Tax=unclassified Chelatococcus TaxID=2638111 RepID=UPI001BCA7B91|nr:MULTISPECIES: hypothetical protein [unclassified Chelatococcus]CAH1654881.1 hypothetical protein CHELA41_20980 [Hyphomicrobiales bacterium]MBS7740309.1 hypothetical protein [Chelatococcus sp. HY11]MBX3544861.1 hypothetical protein [Chelatococcus sp.]MCO5078450.1 hypothetical protein [Chelatococcus sp.]CAH1685282.1 hypothetical protein CHELA20_53947 [Hyphomicrobiales bacterium]